MGKKKMKVILTPTREQIGSGLTSQASWDNPTTIMHLNKIFNIEYGEEITQLEITESVLTARIVRNEN